MVDVNVSDAFSAGIGLALGLAMTQHMFQFMKPQKRIVKQVIVCLNCRGKNPLENKFCGQCGKPLYPPSKVQCPKCHCHDLFYELLWKLRLQAQRMRKKKKHTQLHISRTPRILSHTRTKPRTKRRRRR